MGGILQKWEEFCFFNLSNWEKFCNHKGLFLALTGRNSALNGRNSAIDWEKFCKPFLLACFILALDAEFRAKSKQKIRLAI